VEYIATGDIKVTAWPVKDRFGNDADKSCFVETTSGGATKGDIAPKPTIYPRANGIITGGVTIRVPSGGTVLYTATPNVVVPVIPEVNMDTGKPKAGSTTKLYQAGEEIPFPDAATSFVVCAVTWISGNSLSDFDYVLYKNDANLLPPDAPELLLNGIKYSSSATYPGDGAVSFNHADLLNGEVLFTVNGETPTAGLYNTKTYLPKGGDGIGSFDPTKPYKLTGSSEFITIKAKFHDKKKLLDSPVATYLISVKQMLSAPVASLETDTMVRPGASLNLSLSDDALKQLNSNGKIRVERTTYQAGTDGKDGTDGTDGTDNFPTGAKIKLTGDPPEVGTDYVSYYLDSDSQGYALPSIRYLFGDDTSKMASDGILCRYGQRRVLTVSKTTTDDKGVSHITTEVTVTYRNPQPIALTGTAGQQLKVHAMAVSGVEAHSDSNLVTFRYTIRGSVATPVAFPATDPNKPVSVNIGDRIALSTETADAQIFYTTDGSEPKATYTPPAGTTPGKWEPQEPTKLYDETKSITMEDNEQLLFTVRAFAVSKNFSLENSPSVMFRYQPPAPVQAVFTSPSQGAVVANQPVVLKCTTADAKIFYKIFTSKPSLSDKANIPQPYIDQ
ncbi:MAG: chitobiase/beta-hexosaminidase C-terminal domain-containing protein, partial [Oscillospiraceae bacterium]